MPLTDTQKKYLRRLGHQLRPVVMVGGSGLSKSLLEEFETSLAHHELVKLRIRVGDRRRRDAMIDELCELGSAELVQRVGNMALLYRENPDKKKISLPGTR